MDLCLFPQTLMSPLKTPRPPEVADFRKPPAFKADPTTLPGTIRRDPHAIEQCAAKLPPGCLASAPGLTQLNPCARCFQRRRFSYLICFRRITVERPLRLNFRIDDERIERLQQQTTFQNLAKSRKKGAAEAEIAEGRELQEAILGALRAAQAACSWSGRGSLDLYEPEAGGEIYA